MAMQLLVFATTGTNRGGGATPAQKAGGDGSK